MSEKEEYKFWRDWMWNDLLFPKSTWAFFITMIILFGFIEYKIIRGY